MLSEMAECGILAIIAPEIDASRPRPDMQDAILRLAALVSGPDAASAIAQRWKLSRADAKRLVLGVQPAGELLASPDAARLALYHDGRQAMRDRSALAQVRGEVVRADVQSVIDGWPIPVFPLKGRDLMNARMPPGPEIGQLLQRLEARWIDSGFTADRDMCLAWLQEAVSDPADRGSTPPTA